MGKLIDSDEFVKQIVKINDLRTLSTKTIGEAIDSTPEAIVRCKNCEFYSSENGGYCTRCNTNAPQVPKLYCDGHYICKRCRQFIRKNDRYCKYCGAFFLFDATEKIETLPEKKFIEIITTYPAICTYPEYKGKPYFSIRYEENGEIYEGFGTYKPEVLSEYIRKYFMMEGEETDG